MIKLLIVLGAVGLLSSCSNSFKSSVVRFNDLSQPHGETVTIISADPAKATSLEFASYASVVGSYLAMQGYLPADKGKADLIVSLGYSVDNGKVMVRGYSFGYGVGAGFGYGGYGFFGNYYNPFYGSFGDDFGFGSPFERNIQSYVNYTRKLTIKIRPNVKNEQNLFEGTVESAGRSNNLPKLIPYMIQAMFTDFPGVNGTTKQVVINLDKE